MTKVLRRASRLCNGDVVRMHDVDDWRAVNDVLSTRNEDDVVLLFQDGTWLEVDKSQGFEVRAHTEDMKPRLEYLERTLEEYRNRTSQEVTAILEQVMRFEKQNERTATFGERIDYLEVFVGSHCIYNNKSLRARVDRLEKPLEQEPEPEGE